MEAQASNIFLSIWNQ